MLHIARDKRHPTRHDLGSILCLNVLDLLPPDTVRVREWDDPRAPRPAWLTGTPTLVTPKDEIFRGHQALVYLQRLAVDMTAQLAAASAPKKAPRGVQPPPAAAMKAGPPPPSHEEEADGVGALWESRIGDGDVEEEDDTSNRKITGDDLARAMRAREQARGGS
jgi:hypothetical protein